MLNFKIVKLLVWASLAFLSLSNVFAQPNPNTSAALTPLIPSSDQRILILIDSSGTIVNGSQTKINLTQQVLNDVISRRTQALHIAANRYQFSNDPQCHIYNVLVMSGDADPSKVQALISTLPPASNDPLPAAFNQAIMGLTKQSLSAAIMTLSTNANCNIDVCNQLNLLKTNADQFTTYIIAFQSTPQQQKALQCLSQVPNGHYFNVENLTDLMAALNTALKPIESPAGFGSVSLKAVSQETGHMLNNDVRWWALVPASIPGTQPTIEQYSNQPFPHFLLPPGQYEIQLTYGEAAVKKSITVTSGQAQALVLPITTSTEYKVPVPGAMPSTNPTLK